MSAIYFHSKIGDVAVRGPERAHFGIICSDITYAVLRSATEEWGDKRSVLRRAFPESHYLSSSNDLRRDLPSALNVGSFDFILDSKVIDSFSLVLNTALCMGSDMIKLAARLHGQCELHAYVEGKNREWLAGIIAAGRAAEFLRSGMGWEDVIDLLKSDDREPVVTSYSVCDQFPNSYVANWEPPLYEDGEPNYDAWYDLPDDERWQLAVAGLRESGGGLEMKPDNWATFCFGSGIDANQLLATLYRATDAGADVDGR